MVNWKGGIRSNEGPYILVYKPEHPNADHDGCVSLHRLVMEQYIGRYLTRNEVVHHIDGNKRNNDISNLQLFASHSEHVSFERTGTKLSDETKYKIGLTKLGNKYFLGKKHSDETKAKIKAARKLQPPPNSGKRY